MDPNEIVRPQEERTVWVYGSPHPKQGQVATPNADGAFPVIRTTVYRRDGRVEVWQRSPSDVPTQGVLMPDQGYIDDKIAAEYQKDKEKAEAEAAKPPAAPTTRNINGVPHQVVGKDANGQDIWAPAQTAAGPATATGGATRTPEREAEDKAAENERSWNEANGPGKPGTSAGDAGRGSGFRETHLERRTREAKEKADADAAAVRNRPTTVSTNTTEPFIVQQMPDGSIRTTPNQNYQGEKPQRSTVKGSDGRTYVVTVGADNKPTAVPVEGLPSEGAATAGGPPMPQIVVGMAEQALTAYHTALWSDPTLTPAIREKRFQEAVQVANLAATNAATEQRERESQRNADYNVASTKLTQMGSGLNNALTFVSQLNGSLPKGSDLGGRAFAAIMGLQLLQMKMSGIDNLSRPGTSSERARTQVPTITARDLSNPAAMSGHNATIATQTAAAAAPPPTAAPAASVPRTGAMGAAAPIARPDQTQVGTQIDDAIMPPQAVGGRDGNERPDDMLTVSTPEGAINTITRAQWDAHPENQSSFRVVNAESAAAFASRQAGGQVSPTPAGLSPETGTPVPYGKPGASWMPPADPNDPINQPQDGRVLPQPAPAPIFTPPAQPSQYEGGGDVQMSPSDFPALAQFGMMGASPQQQQPSGPTPGMDDPAMAAARRAQIAATPPWRIPDEDWEYAAANGFLDDARRVPTMGMVA